MQLKHLYQKTKFLNQSNEDFVRINKPHSFITKTDNSNSGSFYNILPKEILFDSTENVTAKHMVKINGTQMNRGLNDTDQSISDFRNHTLKYPYSPFIKRTFVVEELENEKFTGTFVGHFLDFIVQ